MSVNADRGLVPLLLAAVTAKLYPAQVVGQVAVIGSDADNAEIPLGLDITLKTERGLPPLTTPPTVTITVLEASPVLTDTPVGIPGGDAAEGDEILTV
jgi:hypothetical protein